MMKHWPAVVAAFAFGLIVGIVAVLAFRDTGGAGRIVANASTEPTQGEQLYTCGMHPQVILDHPGNCPICHMKLIPLKSGSDADRVNDAKGPRKIRYWWDPMLGPSSISDKPGKSAMGMDLIPVYEESQSGGAAVTIDPTVIQNMGIRTATVTRGPLAKTVRAVGFLRAPEMGLVDVSLKISGWIDKLYANQEGMHVNKGEPLFDLYSPDLQVAEEELISATKTLHALSPDAGDQVRKESAMFVASARRKLQLWGVADQDIDAIAKASEMPRTVTFRSPANGTIVDTSVVEGSAVPAGAKLMRIEDHSKLWLDIQVYEEQMPFIALGQNVEAVVDGIPGRTFTAAIHFIHPHVDPMTRTVTVRTTLDNTAMKMKPGMYATVNILTHPVPDTIQIPREAVIDTGTRQIAFVVQSEGHFAPRKVRMGVEGDNDQVQILEGLVPGEVVVTSGQFLLDVESRTTEAIQKLRDKPSVDATGAPAPATTDPSRIHQPITDQSTTQPATTPTDPSHSMMIETHP